MHHGVPHHLAIGPEHVAGNGPLGRVFLLPGSDGRARRISERFSKATTVPSDRQHNAYLGQVDGPDGPVAVGTVATGMGCPSVDIIVTELISLGARLLLRVGTSGSLQPSAVRAGSLVVATAAVRDEGCSERYACREFPATADLEWVRALEAAVVRGGLAGRTFRGVVHSKDSLFAREFGVGPRADANRDYVRQLTGLGVLASEMECAQLFILGAVHSREVSPLTGPSSPGDVVRCGALLAVIGDDRGLLDRAATAELEAATVEVALSAATSLPSRLRESGGAGRG
jgi:uridine phosphorylase